MVEVDSHTKLFFCGFLLESPVLIAEPQTPGIAYITGLRGGTEYAAQGAYLRDGKEGPGGRSDMQPTHSSSRIHSYKDKGLKVKGERWRGSCS